MSFIQQFCGSVEPAHGLRFKALAFGKLSQIWRNGDFQCQFSSHKDKRIILQHIIRTTDYPLSIPPNSNRKRFILWKIEKYLHWIGLAVLQCSLALVFSAELIRSWPFVASSVAVGSMWLMRHWPLRPAARTRFRAREWLTKENCLSK